MSMDISILIILTFVLSTVTLTIEKDEKKPVLAKHHLQTLVPRSNWTFEEQSCAQFENSGSYSRKELNDHYNDIMQKTSRWRSCPVHSYKPMTGGEQVEWMENLWMRIFTAKIAEAGDVTEVFPGGVVPLFIGWVDCHVAGNITTDRELVRDLNATLRSDILYVTVSQAGAGIIPQRFKIFPPFFFKNIFVFSAGGYGHAPIPLLPPLQAAPLSQLCGEPNQKDCRYSAAFAGRRKTGPLRNTIMNTLQKLKDKTVYCSDPVSNWKDILLDSKVALCPRGFGRTSFKCFEAIQMGMIPVYIYSDLAWEPYAGTQAAMSTLGLVSGMSDRNIRSMIGVVKKWGRNEVSRRRSAVQAVVSSHYTMSGLMDQIELYVKYGPSVSDIRCTKVPQTQK